MSQWNPPINAKPRPRWRASIAIGLLLVLVLPPVTLWFLFEEGGVHAGRALKVRAATSADFASQFNMGDWTDPAPRPIAVAEGTVTKATRVRATLYIVRDGTATKVNSASAFPSPHERGGPRWRKCRIVFALAETERPEGRITWVIARGLSGGGGGGSEISHRVEGKFRQVFAGEIETSRTRLLYIEGDREFGAHPKMTVEEFAISNVGNFLVGTVTK